MQCAECGSNDVTYVNSGLCKCKDCGTYSPDDSTDTKDDDDFFEATFEKIKHKDPKDLWDE